MTTRWNARPCAALVTVLLVACGGSRTKESAETQAEALHAPIAECESYAAALARCLEGLGPEAAPLADRHARETREALTT